MAPDAAIADEGGSVRLDRPGAGASSVADPDPKPLAEWLAGSAAAATIMVPPPNGADCSAWPEVNPRGVASIAVALAAWASRRECESSLAA